MVVCTSDTLCMLQNPHSKTTTTILPNVSLRNGCKCDQIPEVNPKVHMLEQECNVSTVESKSKPTDD